MRRAGGARAVRRECGNESAGVTTLRQENPRCTPHHGTGLEALAAALSKGGLAATSHLYLAGNGGNEETKAALRGAFRGKAVEV